MSLNGQHGEKLSISTQNSSHILDDTLYKHHTQFTQHRLSPQHQLSIELYLTSDEIIRTLTKLTNRGDRLTPIKCPIPHLHRKHPCSLVRDGLRLPLIAHPSFMRPWSDRTKRASCEGECQLRRRNHWTSWPRSEFWVSVSASQVYDVQPT